MAADADPEHDLELEGHLLRRAEKAIDAAGQIRDESEAIGSVSDSLSESRMAARCAWCGRFRVGERWVVIEEMPAFGDASKVTHGICGACVEALRAAGMSV
ncbi:MAG TPA: hypothetical protein VFM43_08395 [Gaiellaceae bacterium]|nr:hypothetical protein [Gaiellaceae bacterium]